MLTRTAVCINRNELCLVHVGAPQSSLTAALFLEVELHEEKTEQVEKPAAGEPISFRTGWCGRPISELPDRGRANGIAAANGKYFYSPKHKWKHFILNVKVIQIRAQCYV